jgi:hypothetical protein
MSEDFFMKSVQKAHEDLKCNIEKHIKDPIIKKQIMDDLGTLMKHLDYFYNQQRWG